MFSSLESLSAIGSKAILRYIMRRLEKSNVKSNYFGKEDIPRFTDLVFLSRLSNCSRAPEPLRGASLM